MIKLHPELAQPAQVQAKAPVAANDKAAQIEAARNKQKTTVTSTRSPSAPAKVGMPTDPDALFKKYSEELLQKRLGN